MNKKITDKATEIKHLPQKIQGGFKERRERFCGFCEICGLHFNARIHFHSYSDFVNMRSFMNKQFLSTFHQSLNPTPYSHFLYGGTKPMMKNDTSFGAKGIKMEKLCVTLRLF